MYCLHAELTSNHNSYSKHSSSAGRDNADNLENSIRVPVERLEQNDEFAKEAQEEESANQAEFSSRTAGTSLLRYYTYFKSCYDAYISNMNSNYTLHAAVF